MWEIANTPHTAVHVALWRSTVVRRVSWKIGETAQLRMQQLTAHKTPARGRCITVVSETQVYLRCDKAHKYKLHWQVRSVNGDASVVAIPLLGLHELAAAELACILLAFRGVGCNRDPAAGDDHWPSWGTRVDRALGHVPAARDARAGVPPAYIPPPRVNVGEVGTQV